MLNDRYGMVGMGLGAGTLRVRVRYMGPVGTVHGYLFRIILYYVIWVHGMGTIGTVHWYENRTYISYRP